MRKMEVVVDFEPADEREWVSFAEHGHFQQKTNTFADLYINIRVKEHPIFKFVRPDIHTDHKLSISEAILGTKIKVSTFFGQKEVDVPPATHHGDIIRIKGYGAKYPIQGDHI